MREGGDSRYSHSSPKIMTNDKCHASFMGSRSCAWAFVFMHGRPSSCVGDCLHAWVTVFVCGGHFCVWAVGLMHGWLLALVGSLLRVGSLSCGSAGTIAEGWVVLTVLKNNDEQRISIRRSSFGCHITDSDVAPCSVCFACVLRLSWLCGARWQAWCLAMDGESRSGQATCVDDGGSVERLWD